MSDELGIQTETFDCFEEAGADSNYSLRIAALFAILAVSFIGGSLPYIFKSAHLDRVFFFGTVFAAGVVIATGFVHILPDASNALSNPCLGLSTEYPWAFTFAGSFVIITFAIEYFVRIFIRRRYGLGEGATSAWDHGHGHDGADLELADPAKMTVEETKAFNVQVTEAKVAAIMLEAGVIFHSIFIGIDIGVNNDPSVVRPLMIALMFHQGFEGLALGSTFVRAQYGTIKYFILLIAYVLVTPIGIAIGIGVSKTYSENGKTALGFEGAFNSVSAGILIYNGIVDILLPTVMTTDILTNKRGMQLLTMFCLAAGYAIMALIAKWA